VTVDPRFWPRKRVEKHLARHFRVRRKHGAIEIDFPKRKDRQVARAEVVKALDEGGRSWRLWYRLYPRKRSTR